MRAIFQRQAEPLPAEIHVWRPAADRFVKVAEDVEIWVQTEKGSAMIGTGFISAVEASSYFVMVHRPAADD